MRVGILTSHNVRCGVAQYSERFADALAGIDGVEPVILAARTTADQFDLPEESEHEVIDVGYCGHYSPPDYQPMLDIPTIVAAGLDAIHVQYQCMIFRQEHLLAMTQQVACPVALTFHDNCIAPNFPTEAFRLRYSHRQGVGIAAGVIPFPVEVRQPIVRSFGLGRSQSDIVRPVVEDLGYRFEDIGPSPGWLSHEDLMTWLRGADAIVLWYPPEPRAGSSQAARDALAARRPLITNNTEWFSDLPSGTLAYDDIGYEKVETPDELRRGLRRLLDHRDAWFDQCSWNTIARRLVADYVAVGARAPASAAADSMGGETPAGVPAVGTGA